MTELPHDCITCDPKSIPPEFCPGQKQCPKCGKPTCPCPGHPCPPHPGPPGPPGPKKGCENTYSFYAWFGREQDETHGSSASINKIPPFYYLNNVDFADLDGELAFLLNEWIGDGAFGTEGARKYDINVIDKWLITYKPIDNVCKLGEFKSMQNTVMGPFNCPGELNDGNGTHWYPFTHDSNSINNYSTLPRTFESIKNTIDQQHICIDNNDTECKCSACKPGICKNCSGARLLELTPWDPPPLGVPPCNTSDVTGWTETILDVHEPSIVYQKQEATDSGHPGVYITGIGECPNLPAEVNWNKDLGKDKIPTKCNGSYTFNCSGNASFNEQCMKGTNKEFIKSKLRINTINKDDLNQNEYMAQYIGSIRLDDLANGSNTIPSDTCRKKIKNNLDKLKIKRCGGLDGAKCNNDKDSPFWKQQYSVIREFFSDPDNYCSQTSTGGYDVKPYGARPDPIHTINPDTGEFKPLPL